MKRSVLSLSLEAVRFQKDDRIFREFAEEFRKLREIYSKSQVFSGEDFQPLMEKLVEHFDINATYVLPRTRKGFEFAISPPDVDSNNPIAYDDMRFYRDSSEGISHLRRNAGVIEGGVDDNGRVYGVFAKMRVYFIVGFGWFHNQFTPEHMAALMMHEVGHYDSYVRALKESVTYSTILAAVAQEWSGASSDVRMKLIDKAAKTLNTEIDPKMAAQAVRLNNIEGVVSVFVTNRVLEPRSAMNTPGMDYSQWEAAADQFAVRMGAGVYLAEANHMANKYDPELFRKNRSVYLSNLGHILACLANGGFIVAMGAAMGGGVVPVMVLGVLNALASYYIVGWGSSGSPFGASYEIYDNPVRRIERIMVEMRAELKRRDLPAKQAKASLRAIDDIEHMMSEYYTAVPLAYRFATLFSSDYRSTRYREQQQRTLESLANNELFVAAAAVRTA